MDSDYHRRKPMSKHKDTDRHEYTDMLRQTRASTLHEYLLLSLETPVSVVQQATNSRHIPIQHTSGATHTASHHSISITNTHTHTHTDKHTPKHTHAHWHTQKRHPPTHIPKARTHTHTPKHTPPFT
eukprot:GHVQ01021913.1.p2 GENE.GHVQ01021913.1~~GHVQ01021913.1.p2  ORF type:complete len:127 (+),score=33.95 GHVQ01021913.1:568-948(+)